jgi:hypothetical protein
LASRNIEYRIFGKPMQFWAQIADAGGERYLKSYCFGTSLSSPRQGYTFGDYNRPRGLELFEPCSMANFTDYGRWFQKENVADIEPVDVIRVAQKDGRFVLTLNSGERVTASRVVVATGLAYFATTPAIFGGLPTGLAIHTNKISSFTPFRGQSVAVIGAGQSALEAAALLREVGAHPQLLVREEQVHWHDRVSFEGRSMWERLRSPIVGLGSGPKAWALNSFPGALHRIPDEWRMRFTQNHLPAEGAWWLRSRVEGVVPMDVNTSVTAAREVGGRVSLSLSDHKTGTASERVFDRVVLGTGFDINVSRLEFIDKDIRSAITRVGRSAKLNHNFQSSVPGLHFIGPMSAMSFGPLFRFVIGSSYTVRTLAAHLASSVERVSASQKVASVA